MNDSRCPANVACWLATHLQFLLALGFLTGGAMAQGLSQVAPIPAPIKNAGTYRVAAGEWIRSSSFYGGPSYGALFRNDINANYWALFGQDEVVYEEGRLPGHGVPLITGQPELGTADRYAIEGFEIGYCTLLSDPVTYSISFLNEYRPCSDPEGLPLVASFSVSGLPSGGCWIMGLDLSGTTAAFELDAEGGDGTWDNDSERDSFGMRLQIDASQGNELNTGNSAGFLLAGNLCNSSSEGAGTVFKQPQEPGTGLDTETLFWLTSPIVTDGCYFYQSCALAEGMYTVLYGSEANAPEAFCEPAGPNSFSPDGARLTSLSGFATDQARFRLHDVPAQPGLLFTGNLPIDLPFGCGRRCVGGNLTRFGPFNTGDRPQNGFDVVIDMTQGGSGATNVQYWFRDPENASSCGDVFNLSNALGL